MTPLTDICRWLLDTTAATTFLLAATLAALCFIRQPARRQRLGEWTLAGCLAIALIHALPGLPHFSLAWFEANPRATLADGFFEDAATVAITPPQIPSIQQPPSPIPPTPPAASHPASLTLYWREMLAALYLSLALVATARLTFAWFRLRRMVYNAQAPAPPLATLFRNLTPPKSTHIRLLISRTIDHPFTFGLRHPVILLPRHLAAAATPEELAAILRHELTHIRRRDARTWLLSAAASILLGPSPLLLLLHRQLRLSQEFIADHAAAATDRAAYAQSLLRLVQTARPATIPLTAAAWTTRSDLYLRMRRLLTTDSPTHHGVARRWSAAAAAIILLISGTLAAVSLAGTTPEARLRTAERRGILFLLTQQEPPANNNRGGGGWLTRYGPAPTALAVRALLQSGLPPTHPAIQRALAYIETTRQSDGGYYTDAEPTYHTAIVLSMFAALDTADARARIDAGRTFLQHATPTPAAAPRPGGWYAPATPLRAGASRFAEPAERAADAVLDTYGSLTYARWKSLLYAGLAPNDPRVITAARWLDTHWTVEEHPGTGSAEGLFYYYLAAARTLRASGQSTLTGPAHTPHLWRADLQQKLSALQNPDGSWTNRQSSRWLEDQPAIVTTYALLTLQETRK